MQLEKIPSNKELIIFDFYETVMYVAYYYKYYLRNGIRELTEYLLEQNKLVVISSDGNKADILFDFGYAATDDFQMRFKKIYGSESLIYDKNKEVFYKNLELICDEQKISKNQSLLIGDNFKGSYNPLGMDKTSAEYFGIDYIIVPRQSMNPDFSFTSLVESC